MIALKKVVRIFVLFFLISLACTGAGIVGAFLPNNRERYVDKEIQIEQVDKNKDEEGEEFKETKD